VIQGNTRIVRGCGSRHEYDWYYLLGETTDQGVAAYLDLANRGGLENEWTVRDENANGQQPVVFGQARTPIPGFLFYRCATDQRAAGVSG
jgi:hypothetical protein